MVDLVGPNTTEATISRWRRFLAIKLHPDKFAQCPAAQGDCKHAGTYADHIANMAKWCVRQSGPRFEPGSGDTRLHDTHRGKIYNGGQQQFEPGPDYYKDKEVLGFRPRYEAKTRPFWISPFQWRWRKESYFVNQKMISNDMDICFVDLVTSDRIYATDVIELF